ncbi:MAG: hypothetical protein J6575_08410 [Bifidobacterium sp.]|nr:hypothetical protein [Bifidobacterium sp.]
MAVVGAGRGGCPAGRTGGRRDEPAGVRETHRLVLAGLPPAAETGQGALR